MFYSSCEIDLMAKSYGERLRRSCENVNCTGNKNKQPRLFRLLLVLIAKVQERTHKGQDGL